MCFLLYAGTSMPMPRKEWHNETPDLSVHALTERESPIAAYFSKPAVQYIGSTSGCGCDFPHVMFQNGDWPWLDHGEHDPKQQASADCNRKGLVDLLKISGERVVELYGVWDGNFAITPAVREEIAFTAILDPSFRFKEQGFYVVRLA